MTLISVCALIVSITQTRVMIRQSEMMDTQARASLRPILAFDRLRAFDPDNRQLTDYRLFISNNGLGPAYIDAATIRYRDAPLTSWEDLMDRAGVADSLPRHLTTGNIGNTVVKAGQTINFLDMSSNLPLARALQPALDELQLTIRYSSVYGDRYEGRLTSEGWVNAPVED